MTDSNVIILREGIVANRIRHSVSREGGEVFLPRQLFEIFLQVAAAKFGTTPERLFNLIYADDVNGGPITGRKAMCVQRVNLNRKLAPLHLKITSGGAGRRGGLYELLVLPWKETAIRDPTQKCMEDRRSN